ncbi:MAG: peroxiredoxin family protein [archaeon]|nr:peroxiredoxin family protein [archaeon]
MVLDIGDEAPDFTAMSTSGNYFNLYREIESGPILINFYIGDFGINCTNYMKKFVESYSKILDLGVKLVAINDDSLDSHNIFKSRLNAPFEYLYDKDKKIAMKYGAIVGPGYMTTGFTNREFYLVSKDRKIRYIWKAITPKVLPDLGDIVDGIRSNLSISKS